MLRVPPSGKNPDRLIKYTKSRATKKEGSEIEIYARSEKNLSNHEPSLYPANTAMGIAINQLKTIEKIARQRVFLILNFIKLLTGI